MDECGVCMGQCGKPACTLTVTADDTGEDVDVRVCRECVAAVFATLADRWNTAIDQGNLAVEYLREMLGIER